MQVWSQSMSADDDAALSRLLLSLVTDVLAWLDDCPGDQVEASAVASFRQSIDWVIERLPAEQRDRFASGAPDPTSLRIVAGLLVDLSWWLDTCEDDEVDLDLAVKLQESASAYLDALSDEQRRRLLEVLDELAWVIHGDRRSWAFVGV
jgi:hypothetical protein